MHTVYDLNSVGKVCYTPLIRNSVSSVRWPETSASVVLVSFTEANFEHFKYIA